MGLGPTLQMRDAVKKAAPIRRVPPARSCGPKNWPVLFKIAPETGVPIRRPKAETAKLMPMRVPTTPRCGDKVVSAVGGRDTNVPEVNPYNIAKTTRPGVVLIRIQQRESTAVTKAHGINMLSGPVLSAKKFGITRPKIEAALRIGSI